MSHNEEKIKLFVADDHTIVRKALIQLFSLYADIEVVGEAEDGKSAVELINAFQTDVVLMDIAMPVMNGLEATQRIKNNHPEVKVLILSAHENDKYIHGVIRAGAHGYLVKNVDAGRLIEAIRAVYRNEYVFPESVRGLLSDEINRLQKGESPEGISESFHGLTGREREILQLIAEGMNHQQIADLLHISIRTVDTHRNNILKKLDVHNTAGLVLYAIKNGILILPR